MEKIYLVCSVLFCIFTSFTFFSRVIVASDGNRVFVKRSFDSLYEPSAVVTLSDKKIIIFEDEGLNSISAHFIEEDSQGFLLRQHDSEYPEVEVDDIEGAAVLDGRSIFALTSHSRNKKGERREKRERLIVLSGKNAQLYSDIGIMDAVRHYLQEQYSLKNEELDSINIEGLSFTPDGTTLLVGLRQPTYKGNAIIIPLVNVDEISSTNFAPQFARQPILLDIGGGGVRSITYDTLSSRYYLASETKNKKGRLRSQLWAWSGVGQETIPLKVKGLKSFKNIEGLSVVPYRGERILLLVCDDGNKKKGKGASYALVRVDQLKTKKK